MTIHIEHEEDKTIIHLDEKFDFSGADDFKSAYVNHPSPSYIIDFMNTDYMDSSGLGMLLNMRRSLEDKPMNMRRSLEDKPISLINCKPQIKRVLAISRFDEQFIIH